MKKILLLFAMAISLATCTGKNGAEASCTGQLSWFDIKGPAKTVTFDDCNISLLFDNNGVIQPSAETGLTVDVNAQGNGKVVCNDNTMIIKDGKLAEIIVTNTGWQMMCLEIRYQFLSVDPQNGVPAEILITWILDEETNSGEKEKRKVQSFETDKYGNWTKLNFGDSGEMHRTIEYYAEGEKYEKPAELTDAEMRNILQTIVSQYTKAAPQPATLPMSKELIALVEQASMLPYEVVFDPMDGWFWQTFHLFRAIFNSDDGTSDVKFEILDHTTSTDGKSIDAEHWFLVNWGGSTYETFGDMPRVATFIYEDGRWVLDDYYPETFNYHGRALPGDNSVKDKAKEHIKKLNDNIRSGKWKRSLESASHEEEWNPRYTRELNNGLEQYCNKYLK